MYETGPIEPLYTLCSWPRKKWRKFKVWSLTTK